MVYFEKPRAAKASAVLSWDSEREEQDGFPEIQRRSFKNSVPNNERTALFTVYTP